LGRISNNQGDQIAKKAFLSEAAALIESLPDTIEKALAFKNIYLSIAFSSDPITDETIHYFVEFERILRALNNRTELALAVIQRGTWAAIQGDNALAASLSKEAERLVEESNDAHLKARVDLYRAFVDILMSDLVTARQRIFDVIQSIYNRSDHLLRRALVVLAIALLQQDLAAWSAKVLGWSGIAEDAVHSHPDWMIFERLELTRGSYAKLRSQLGDKAFAKMLAAGQQLTLEDLQTIPQPSVSAKDSVDSLTLRETEVLQLLAEELSNPQIAERLVVSRRTVDAHLRSIYDKLDVRSRHTAVRVAREKGLLGS
jgi:ATP/maltotriose-dependent transcriptional regulator MalT